MANLCKKNISRPQRPLKHVKYRQLYKAIYKRIEDAR